MVLNFWAQFLFYLEVESWFVACWIVIKCYSFSSIISLQVKISGYAVSGGGRGIERVDVSIDGGNNWLEASRYQKIDAPYVADDMNSDKWAWVMFEITANIPQSTQIVAKVVCLLLLLLLDSWFMYLYCLSKHVSSYLLLISW